MIKVRFSDTDALCLRISGHAGYAESGKDIICAGVSSIAYALLGYLAKIDETLEFKIEEGYMCIISSSCDQRVEATFDMAFLGLRQLEHEYPEHISVKK